MFRRKDRSVSMPNHAASNSKVLSKNLKRNASVPGTLVEYLSIKGVMRVNSLDASLHAKGLTRSDPSRNIVWDKVRIREYSRALGDNPSCSSGPPVSIGWEYSPKEIQIKLEKYETTRPPRRTMQEMVLPREVRFKMLTQEWDVSRKDCAQATRESLKLKNQRRRTVHNLSKVNPDTAEKMESVGKKFKMGLSFKKTQSTEDLMAAAEEAAAALQQAASRAYEWEDEDEPQEMKETSSQSVEDYDAVGYDHDMDAMDEKKEEPETAHPQVKKPIIITEDDAGEETC